MSLIIAVPFVILLSLFFIIYESLLGGIACLVSTLVIFYMSWRLGRERAGWGG